MIAILFGDLKLEPFLGIWSLGFGISDCLQQRCSVWSSELGDEFLDKLLNNLRALLFVPPKAGPTFGHGGRDRDICPTLRFSAQNSIAHVQNSPRQMRGCHLSDTNKPVVIEIVQKRPGFVRLFDGSDVVQLG